MTAAERQYSGGEAGELRAIVSRVKEESSFSPRGEYPFRLRHYEQERQLEFLVAQVAHAMHRYIDI